MNMLDWIILAAFFLLIALGHASTTPIALFALFLVLAAGRFAIGERIKFPRRTTP